MSTKRLLFLLVCCIPALVGKSQNTLSESTSLLRAGDVIIKQELQYQNPGRSGKDVIWDFSELTSLGSEYVERLVGKIDSSLICLGYDNGYKYKLSGDSLFCIGYQTPNLCVDYLLPELQRAFPTSYKDSIHSFYYGEGVYSRTLPIIIYGETTHVVDGEGKLLLPDGDSLKNVLRVRSTAHIGQKMSPFTSIYANGDTSRYSIDSLLYRLQNDKITWEATTYKWYAPGYRYPVFETVQNHIVSASNKKLHFNRSYYFPIREHEYLSEDPNNKEIFAKQLQQADTRLIPWDLQQREKLNSKENYTYNHSVNANKILNIEYQLKTYATVEIYLYSVGGYTLWHKPPVELIPGTYTDTCNLSPFEAGTYLLAFFVNGQLHTEKIQNK